MRIKHYGLKRRLIISLGVLTCFLISACAGKPISLEQQRRLQHNLERNSALMQDHYQTLISHLGPICRRGSCKYPLVYDPKDRTINAYADGRRVVITRGMLEFIEKVEYLDLVMAHEIAHNIMDHMTAKLKNRMLGLAVDSLFAINGYNTKGSFTDLGSYIYSQAYELEADYIGMYIMARAGFPIENAGQLWRAMAHSQPEQITGSFMSSHPSSAERFVALSKTVEEIRNKQQAGLPLVPEYLKP